MMGLKEELTEKAKMLATSLAYSGKMTIDDIYKLDWLKTTSYYGISLYLEIAIKNGWIKSKGSQNEIVIYSVTAKGRKMVEERESD